MLLRTSAEALLGVPSEGEGVETLVEVLCCFSWAISCKTKVFILDLEKKELRSLGKTPSFFFPPEWSFV